MIASDPETLALWTLILPFVSFFISFIIPERYSWTAPLCASLLTFISTLLAGMLFASSGQDTLIEFHYHWFNAGTYPVIAGLRLDPMTTSMTLVVSLISFLTHVYAIGYMAGESGLQRFFGLLGLFTFSMLGIVLSSNLIVLFVFWELVSLSSYLLIGFWFDRASAASAATKAFLTNRLSDAFLLIGILLILVTFGTTDITELQNSTTTIPGQTLTFIGICVVIGTMGKSAQFPLSGWLPDAMEGPTPVSALIHAATMVAAGVFLLGRLHFIFTPDVLHLITVIGAISSLLGAIAAMVEYDLKRILAYSTISQLGLMVLAMGNGDPAASQIFLTTHAFYKACLFLAAGAVIQGLHHSLSDKANQDIRQLGGLSSKMRFVFVVFAIAACSLAGIPLFSGFLSKEILLSSLHGAGWQVFVLLISMLTVIYSYRLVWFVFLRPSDKAQVSEPQITPLVMKVPLLMLALGSTWVVVAYVPFQLSGWLALFLSTSTYSVSTIFLTLSAGSILLTAIGCYFYFHKTEKGKTPMTVPAWLSSLNSLSLRRPVVVIATFTRYIDKKWIDGTLHAIAYSHVTLSHLTRWFDHNFVDGLVIVSAKVPMTLGAITRSVVNGKIQSYILWAAAGLTLFIVWTLLQ